LQAFESASFSNAKMMLSGQLPFRDIQLEHGLWQDGLINVLGAKIAGPSFYQMQLGYSGLIHPLEVVIFLVPIFILTRKLLVVLSFTLIFEFAPQLFGIQQVWQSSLLLVPMTLLVFRKLLERHVFSPLFSLLTGAIFAVGIILNYEFSYVVSGAIAEIVLLFIKSKGQRALITKNFFFVALGFVTFISCLLEPFGLLMVFIKSFYYTSSGFYFAWGANFYPGLGFSYFAANIFVPLAIFYLVVLHVRGFSLSSHTNPVFALLPALFLAIGLYLKYLQWPDWHIQFPIDVLILIFVILFAPLFPNHMDFSEYRSIFGVFMGALCLLIAGSNPPLIQPGDTISKTVGPANATTDSYISRITSVDKTFSSFLKNQDRIFDFSNEPVSWFGVAGYKSIGVSKILNFPAVISQEYVIQVLEKHPTVDIVWGGEFGYWAWPFNGNWISKYLVSEYILKHYTPIANDGGYFLLARNSTSAQGSEVLKVKLRNVNCDYGLSAPRFSFSDIYSQKMAPTQSLANGTTLPGTALFLSHLIAEPDKSGYVVLTDRAGIRISFYASAKKFNRIYLGGCPAVYNQPKGDLWTLSFDGLLRIVTF
jgi:hypothetical protein